MENEKKFSRAKKWLAIIAGLLVVCTVLMWGIATNWGSVKITRVSIAGNNGTTMTAIQFIPKGVSAENPAPVVLTNHGANNSAYSEFVYGLEFARRGYVVFCCDQPNSGEAPINTNDSFRNIFDSWIDYAHSQKYIDGRVVVTGLSRGGMNLNAFLMDSEFSAKIDCAVNIVGAGGLRSSTVPFGTNFCAVWAAADGIDANSFFGYDENGVDKRLLMVRELLGDNSYEYGTLLGSFEDGTAMQFNAVFAVHPFCYIFKGVHSTMYNFVGKAVPTGTSLAPDNLVYKTFLLVSWICCFLFICMGATFASMMASAPGFCTSMQTQLPAGQAVGAKKRAIRIAMDLVVPFVFYPIFATLVSKATFLNVIFRCTSINPIIGWLLFVAIFGAASLYVRTKNIKKERKLNAADFGMGNADDKKIISWNRVKNGAVIGIITTIVLFVWVAVVIDITGINYSANAFAFFTRMTPQRFVRGLPYLVVILPIVLMININIATIRRFPDTGSETRDTTRDIVYNILLATVPLMTIMFCYYGVGLIRGTGIGLLLGGWQTAINYTLGFPFMKGSSVGISTFLNRKTGNIWAGVFTATLILGLFTITAPMMAS